MSTWWQSQILSGIDIDDIEGAYPAKKPSQYNLGYIIAHEFAHQLDAFALMQQEGNLKNRGYEGHYNGINLLMPGQKKTKAMKRGGQHELLLPEIRERILRYVNF